MTRAKKIARASALFALALLLAAADAPKPLQSSTTTDGIQITLNIPPTLICGTEAPIQLLIQNNSPDALEYFTYNELKNATLEVKRDGRPMASTELCQSWTNGAIFIRLAPTRLEKGQQLAIPLNLTRLFDLSVPGTYEISATWTAYNPTTKKTITVTTSLKTLACDPSDPRAQPATAPSSPPK